jgi:hypothetical protein
MQGFGTCKENRIHYRTNACKQTGIFIGDNILTCNKMKIYLHQYMTYYKPHKMLYTSGSMFVALEAGYDGGGGSRRLQSWTVNFVSYRVIATKRSVTNDKLNTVAPVTVMVLNPVCDTDLINYAKITSNIFTEFRCFHSYLDLAGCHFTDTQFHCFCVYYSRRSRDLTVFKAWPTYPRTME